MIKSHDFKIGYVYTISSRLLLGFPSSTQLYLSSIGFDMNTGPTPKMADSRTKNVVNRRRSVSLLDSSLGKNDFAGGLIIQYFFFIFIDETLRISHLIGPKVKLHITWMPREGKKACVIAG